MLFSFENLHRRYLACRRNKRNTVNALRFEVRQEENLLDLRAALEDRTYHPGRSVCFVCKRPKLREIFAADFRDRVVHHVLVYELEKVWERIFIHDAYACRRGKGVHAGVKRLRTFMGQVTANGSRPAWYLQLDIRNFFMSIDKQVLFDLLAAKIRDPEVLWLTRVLVFHDCTRDYVMKGDPALFERLPAHKTLFGRGPGKGLPIGNLNSQFFANVYLNGLDQFVKHDLKCRHYLRYCDDLVLLATDRAQLVEWRGRIEAYLRERLRLELNPNRARLRPVSDGVDFLGYIVRRDYQLVRRRVVGHLGERLRRFERQLVLDGPGYRRYRFDTGMVDELNAVLASYLGHFRLADSYRLREGLWRRFPFLGEYFDVDPASGRLDRKDRAPAGLRGVARQYRHFRRVFRGNVLFFQVGRFMEFYQPGDLPIAQVLGLAPMSANRRGARDGFPVSQAGRHLLRLLAAGRSVVLIGETGRLLDGVKERVPRYRFECAAQPCKIHGDYKRSSHMIKAGIVGGTGYTGVELLRLLAQHPEVEVSAITSRKEAGMPVADMFPSLRGRVGLAFSTPEDAPLKSCDVVFFATPNGVAMQQTRELLDAGVKVIDLAADFRIQDIGVWSKWYGMEHACPDLVAEAVYGLPEINREKIKTARLIANPGCYPTAVQLGFLPLIEAGAIDTGWLVADCKSGVSGAGRKAEVHTLFAEATDNFKAYAVPGHRHQPEIRQGLARMAGHDVNLTFVPHLTPLVRGIHATLYARLTKDIDLQNLYETRYANEYFVDVLPAKGHPETRSVRASNLCRMAVHRPQGGEAGNNVVVVLSVIDNLVKGASGQAVQNMNLLFGLQENLGLTQVPVSP